MTLPLSPINPNTNTFSDWLFRTNQMANAFSTIAVTTNDSVNGDVVIVGTSRANTLFADNISGGELGNTDVLVFSSNTVANGSLSTFNANTRFDGANNFFANVGNIQVGGVSNTDYVLAANTTTGKLRYIATPELDANGDLVHETIQANTIYATTISGGEVGNTDILNINTDLSVVSNNVTVNSNSADFTVDLFNISGDLLSISSDNVSYTDTMIYLSNTTMTIPVDSDLVIEGMTGPNNVRDSINTLKQEVISFAIALG